jgi:hypothetical protein
MTFAATGSIADIDLQTFLKIYQMNGFTRNLSENSDMWQHFSKLREMDPQAKQLKYLLITSLGYGAIQPVSADGSSSYPKARRTGSSEAAARYKEWAWTVDVPRQLEGKTGSELFQYAKPLAVELDNKQIGYARLKCIELQGDGTGVIGVAASAPTASGGSLTVTLDQTTSNGGRSYIRWWQEGDLVKPYSTAGAARTYDGSLVADYYTIDSVDEAEGTAVITPYNSSDVALTADGSNTIVATDVFVRYGVTANDLTAISTNDYETISESMVGLESLLSDDGRKVHNVARTGNVAGTRRDLSGAVIDNTHFQAALSRAKMKGGKGRFKYSKAFMADPVYDTLVDAHDTDRRFHSITDTDKGVAGIGYVHGRDRLVFEPDEFVHPQRIWILPDGKGAMCYVGRDPTQVKPNGNDPLHLNTTSTGSGYGMNMQTFFEQTGVLLTKFAGPCICIENFSANAL